VSRVDFGDTAGLGIRHVRHDPVAYESHLVQDLRVWSDCPCRLQTSEMILVSDLEDWDLQLEG
jgi:hypothetical protein